MRGLLQGAVKQFRDSVKTEGKDLVISVGRGVLVTTAVWLVQKGMGKFLKQEVSSGGIAKRLHDKTVGLIADRVIEVAVGKKEQPRESERLSPQDTAICEYILGSSRTRDFYRIRECVFSFPSQHVPMIQVMFHRFWHEQCKYTKVLHWISGEKCGHPTLRRIETGEDGGYEVWIEGCVFGKFEMADIVMKLEKWTPGGNITIFSEHADIGQEVLKAFRRFLRDRNYLKGRLVDIDGLLIDASTCPTWDDILLPEELKQTICYHTISFLKKLPVLKEKGLRAYRGNLWRGIPGVGKTMAAKIIARECDGIATFIAANGVELHEPEDLQAIFTMARWLTPTLLLIDDVDRLSPNLLQMLLGELDGMKNNNDLVVVATANNIGGLGEALANRPDRFDVVLTFPEPNTYVRRTLITRLLESISNTLVLDQALLDELVEITEDLSVIQCEEIIRRARIETICTSREDSDEELTPEFLLEIAYQAREIFRTVSLEISKFENGSSGTSRTEVPICSVSDSNSSLYKEK